MRYRLEFSLGIPGEKWMRSSSFPRIYSSKKKALAETEPYATDHGIDYRAVPVRGDKKATKKDAKKKGKR